MRGDLLQIRRLISDDRNASSSSVEVGELYAENIRIFRYFAERARDFGRRYVLRLPSEGIAQSIREESESIFVLSNQVTSSEECVALFD